MKRKSDYKAISSLIGCVLASLVLTGNAIADGWQDLGDPSIDINLGSYVLAAGTGLATNQPSDISIDIPAGDSIAQVLLYWTGEFGGDDDTITVDGNVVQGPRIGGPPYDTYRADITDSNWVVAGPNVLSVGGLDFSERNNGAAIVVIMDDGSTADIQILDGSDAAYETISEETVPQDFPVVASTESRTGTVWLIVSDIEIPRPSGVKIIVGGVTNILDDVFGENEGDFLHVEELLVTVPAGATNVTVQVLSIDDETELDPASLGWHFISWVLPEPPVDEGCTYTIGYWKNHDWPSGTNDLSIFTADKAMELLWTPSKKGNAYIILAHQYIGAELNVVNGASIPDDVLLAWVAAQEILTSEPYASDEDIDKKDYPADRALAIDLAGVLDDYNNGYLGPGHCD